MIKLYNTKSNQIEEFKSIHPNQVMMYVCGPTVYNYAHIGNARPIVVFDTLKRVLVANGYEVKYVSNYTDIDDKIINQAKAQQLSEAEIAEKYIAAYEKLMANLYAKPVDQRPRVTHCMADIIAFIEELVNKDLAYQVGDNVYFRVDRIKDYGALSKQNLDELIAGSRVEENTDKESPFDFVLWKKTADDGIKWDSPWGEGRPGWHTECVVMIHESFNTDTIDIHGGGMDLRFPHHENELAQNHAHCGHELANYWVHNAMINIDNEKMSKSLGNVTWAQDMIDQLGSNVVRWLLVSAHYRQTINITAQTIDNCVKEVEKVEKALVMANTQLQVFAEMTAEFDETYYKQFLDCLNDDLNTPNAVSVLFEAIKTLNLELRQAQKNWKRISELVNAILKMIDLLGLNFNLKKFSDADIALYHQWHAAKAEKNFELADRYRAELLTKGLLS